MMMRRSRKASRNDARVATVSPRYALFTTCHPYGPCAWVSLAVQ